MPPPVHAIIMDANLYEKGASPPIVAKTLEPFQIQYICIARDKQCDELVFTFLVKVDLTCLVINYQI